MPTLASYNGPSINELREYNIREIMLSNHYELIWWMAVLGMLSAILLIFYFLTWYLKAQSLLPVKNDSDRKKRVKVFLLAALALIVGAFLISLGLYAKAYQGEVQVCKQKLEKLRRDMLENLEEALEKRTQQSAVPAGGGSQDLKQAGEAAGLKGNARSKRWSFFGEDPRPIVDLSKETRVIALREFSSEDKYQRKWLTPNYVATQDRYSKDVKRSTQELVPFIRELLAKYSSRVLRRKLRWVYAGTPVYEQLKDLINETLDQNPPQNTPSE